MTRSRDDQPPTLREQLLAEQFGTPTPQWRPGIGQTTDTLAAIADRRRTLREIDDTDDRQEATA